MRKSRIALATSVLVGFSALAFAVSAGTASADSHANLSIGSFGDIVVDGVHQRVFISDPTGGKIVVTDYRGKVITEKTGLPQVSGLALSSDSLRLHAALPSAHAIVTLTTDTVAETTRYPVGDGAYPRTVSADGSDRIWFGYSGAEDNGNFGSVNPSDSKVTLNHAPAAKLTSEPYVYTTASAPGTLLVADIFSRELWKYDTSSGTPAETAHVDPSGSGFAVEESAFTADGTGLVRVVNGDVQRVAVSDLATSATYPALARANGVDVNRDGRIAISVANQATGDDVYVFPGDATTAAQTIRLPEGGAEGNPGSGELPNDGIQERGIAWQPGGPRLFAVGRYDGAYRLWVMNEPATPTTPITPVLILSPAGSAYAYGSTASVTAHLGATGTNRTVEIWADPYGPEANRLVKKGTVNSGGNLTATFRLTRNTTFTAKFAGDATHTARTVTSTLNTRVQVSTAISKHYKTGRIGSRKYFYFHQRTTPRFTTTMTMYPGRKQRLVVERYVNGRWQSWSTRDAALNSKGVSTVTFSGKHPLNARFRVRAVYHKGITGDSANWTTYGTWKYFTFRK